MADNGFGAWLDRHRRVLQWLTQLAAVVAMITVPALWLGPSVLWRLPVPTLGALAALVVVYLVALGLAARRPAAGAAARVGAALTFGLACFGAVVMLVLLGGRPTALPLTTQVLATAVLVGLFALLLSRGPARPLAGLLLIGAMASVGLAGQLAFRQGLLPRPVPPQRIVRLLDSSLYQLQLTEYRGFIPHHYRAGGGITAWGEEFLLATGDGRLYVVSEDRDAGTLRTRELPRRVPVNADEFSEQARAMFRDSPNPTVEAARFRVGGVLTLEHEGRRRILASHHFWDGERRCFVVRLSMLEGTPEQLADGNVPLEWRAVHDVQPCLTLNTDNPAGPRFEGLENGGRMVALGTDEILMTVGVHAFDGVMRRENLAQDPQSGYGKILRIDLNSGEARVFTSGHRNPQGLHIDENRDIWSSEHGPRGGDEINRIVEGTNYGWATVTYGTDYARRTWPLNENPGSHIGFERPIFSFVPSPGLSALTTAGAQPFGHWEGDLLIGTLKGQALLRARVRDDRVIFAETIPIGERLRDVVRAPDGRIVLWTDTSAIMYLEPADANRGEALVSGCVACHSLAGWDMSSALGPNLSSILGRRVASRGDFRYSPALEKLGGRWTAERLDAFLADPQAFAPGTTMAYPGIADAEQRRQLVDYLGNLAQPD